MEIQYIWQKQSVVNSNELEKNVGINSFSLQHSLNSLVSFV